MKDDKKEEMRQRIKQTKQAAHDRVVKDGTVQFRLDAGNMDRLLRVADDCKTGTGVLARMWLLERLNQEFPDARAPGTKIYSTEGHSGNRAVHEESFMPTLSYQARSKGPNSTTSSPTVREHGLLATSLEEFIALMNAQAAACNQLIQIAENQNKELSELKKTVRQQGERLAALTSTTKKKT